MIARYRSTCPNCSRVIAAGSTIRKDRELGRYVHAPSFPHEADPYPDTPDGPWKRDGYGHWNEEAALVWWQEVGRFQGEPQEPDYD